MLDRMLRSYVRRHNAGFAKSIYKSIAVPVWRAVSVPLYDITASHRHRYTWFRIPKNGTHSVMALLESHAPPEINSSFVPYFPGRHADHFKFCVMRNPWDRIVSVYCNKVLMKLMFPECWDRDFAYFIDFVSRQDLTRCDAHLRLQTALFPVNGVDFVARMEHFEQDMEIVMERLCIQEQVGHAGEVQHAPYHNYFTQNLRDQIRTLYRADIEYGAYRFEER